MHAKDADGPTTMSKKTEKIELRVSPEDKARLTDLGRARGETVSQIIRGLVARELSGPTPPQELDGDRTMTRSLKSYAVAGGALLALGAVYAATAHAPATAHQAELRVYFAELDADGDGLVTRDEFAAFEAREAREAAFEAAEAAEGAASADPFGVDAACAADWARFEADEAEAEAAEREAAGYFADLDGDGDQQIDYEELRRIFIAEREAEFDETDADFDGYVTRAEFESVWREPFETDADLSPSCNAALEAERRAELEALDPVEVRVKFARYDIDRDGRISRDEFVQH